MRLEGGRRCFVCQRDHLLGLRLRRLDFAQVQLRRPREVQHRNQGGNVIAPAPIDERLLRIRACGLGKAQQPLGARPERKKHRSWIEAEARRDQAAMNIRFANRGRAIEMRPAAGEMASHKGMPSARSMISCRTSRFSHL